MKFKFTNLGIQTALALSAASALIYEVVAINILFFYFIKSSYSVATVLSVFLFGLGVGSFLIHTLSHKIENKKVLFGILQILIAIYAFLVLANLTKIVPEISTLGLFAVSFAILLIPTISLGAIFPLAGSMFIKQKKEIIGLVYSSDLFGAIIGTLIAGFLLIPIFGNKITVFAGVGLNLLSAFIIFPKRKKAFVPLLGIIFLILGTGVLFQKAGGADPAPDQGAESFEVSSVTEGKYQFYANSPYGVIKVDNNTLIIDEREQCSLSYPGDTPERTMVDYALNPLKNDSINVLNIGLGCGLTLSSILERVNATVDVVEINPVVVRANREFTDVLKDERANLIIDDGLSYLRKTDKKYDSILIDIENPAVAHSSNLYTVEAFEIINNSLTEDGTFVLYNYGQRIRYLDILYYSLNEAFPFIYIYPDVFLASKQRLERDGYSPSEPYDILEHAPPGPHEFREYVPSGPYEVNTLDKNLLSQVYTH